MRNCSIMLYFVIKSNHRSDLIEYIYLKNDYDKKPVEIIQTR